MSVGGFMNLENILSDLVKCFYFSDPIGGDIEYIEIPIKVNVENISGQLLEYYQHLSFESDCYFGDQFFGLVLFSIQSNGRELSSWGLEDIHEWKNGRYTIFAKNTSDDVIFCDTSDEKCPVYGIISGGEYYHKLGDSLYDFLSFSIKLIRLEIIDYQGEIYSDNNFNIKEEFINDVSSLINSSFSGKDREGVTKFLL